jgi:nitrous oxidase accessory protein NosD
MSRIVALLGAGVYGALWLLAPVALALEPTLPSSVIVVSQDGSGAYQEIQRAIDEAKPGDTIFIKAGSYREDVVVHSKNHLRLVGEARDRVTIHGLKRVGAFRVGKWPYGANDIEIRDLTISENGGLAVGVFNGSRILLSNIRVLGLLYVQQATGVRIEHSLIAQSETTGVSFADAEGELTENDIRNNDYGVTSSGKSSVRFSGNLIQDNVVAGVVLQGGAKGELVRNTIVKNGSGIVVMDNSQAELMGNIVGANKSGIQIAPQARAHLSFNAVRNDGPDYARPGDPPVPSPDLKPESDLALDPHFVDPAAGDFRLRADTPLVRRGNFEFLGALPPVSSSR